MTTVVISQSNYLPWKGYFQLISMADVFVFYDTVDFTKRDWRSRNKILGPNGFQWMTIPVGSNRGKSIQEVVLPEGEWRENHLETIRRNYAKAPYITDVMRIVSPVYEDATITTLSSFNQSLIHHICAYLGIQTEFRNASEFEHNGDRVEKLISICLQLDATTYLSAPAAKDYISDEFEGTEVSLKWMEYGPYEPYDQNIEPFSDYVSIIDTIAALGPKTREHILL
tara:strand:+ start:254 stop:931 length:678 start_codon:yes stop_codon:yes gene_type:complete